MSFGKFTYWGTTTYGPDRLAYEYGEKFDPGTGFGVPAIPEQFAIVDLAVGEPFDPDTGFGVPAIPAQFAIGDLAIGEPFDPNTGFGVPAIPAQFAIGDLAAAETFDPESGFGVPVYTGSWWTIECPGGTILGSMDIDASNYDPCANVDDGSGCYTPNCWPQPPNRGGWQLNEQYVTGAIPGGITWPSGSISYP